MIILNAVHKAVEHWEASVSYFFFVWGQTLFCVKGELHGSEIMRYGAGITGGGLCSMLRKRSCMIRECRWLDQQQRKPQWVSFMPETQKKNRLRQNRPDSRKNRYPLPVLPSVYRSCPILSTGIFPQTCFGSTPKNTASEAKIPPMRCFLGVFKTDQQTQIQTIGFRKLNKLVFVAVRPKLSVIANQSA